MTTINDIGDLVRVLQEQPQWAEALRSILLSRELLELPERFARFVEATEAFMVATAQNFEAVNRRFDVVEHELAEFKAETNQRFDRMDQRFDRMDQQFVDIGHTLNQMNGRIDNISGPTYESKAGKNLHSFANQSLQIRDTQVLNGSASGLDRGFSQRAGRAVDEGRISWGEHSSLLLADLIFTGRRMSDRSNVYGVVEVSITAGDSDVERALERARILSAVTGETALPVVISANIGENQRQLAERLGVTMVRYSQQ